MGLNHCNNSIWEVSSLIAGEVRKFTMHLFPCFSCGAAAPPFLDMRGLLAK
jgi:hypothetical protein